jgi:hypothetical protein
LFFFRLVKDYFLLECTGAFSLCTDADKERLGRQAIKAIHEQMDDDKDGKIEASESRDVNISFLTNQVDLFYKRLILVY